MNVEYYWRPCNNGTFHLGKRDKDTGKFIGWIKQNSKEAELAPPKPRPDHCGICGSVIRYGNVCADCGGY